MLRSKLTKEENKQLSKVLYVFAVHSVTLEMTASNEVERQEAEQFEESVRFLTGLLDKHGI